MKITKGFFLTAIVTLALSCASSSSAQAARWTEQKANAWYAQQSWLVGSNYIPRSAHSRSRTTR